MAAPGEVEVFQIATESGRCYKHAEFTRQSGAWPNERYFFMGEPRYLGRCVRTENHGWGDEAIIRTIFDNNGIINYVIHNEGRTCYIEVPCRERYTGPLNENKEKKKEVLGELKSMPPISVFPGGTNYHSAKEHFESNAASRGGRKLRSRRIKRRRRQRKTSLKKS